MDPDPSPTDDALSQLQLRIAQRADELVQDSKVLTPLNLHCWFIAESEVMGADAVARDQADF
jgi:hypothetical protein